MSKPEVGGGDVLRVDDSQMTLCIPHTLCPVHSRLSSCSFWPRDEYDIVS